MLASGKAPLIWPLLDRLSPIAQQRRPKAAANAGLVRLPTMPWDDADRPGAPGFGQVESDPRLAELAPLNFGLAALRVQPIALKDLKTNPRAPVVSEQRREPGVIHQLGLWQFIPPPRPPRDDRQTSRIIWPLRDKLGRPKMPASVVLAQQSPRAPARKLPTLLPWARMMPAGAAPSVVHAVAPIPPTRLRIFGVTKDSAGVALGGCSVRLFRTADDVEMDSTVSDGSGNYEFRSAAPAQAYYVVAYKVGAPDVAGTTVNTLAGAP